MMICTMCEQTCDVNGEDGAPLKSACCDATLRYEDYGPFKRGLADTGRKDDSEKIRMDLLPFESLEAVAKVLTFGAKKYADNNWQKVENARTRYIGALLRHLSKYLQGERIDAESELSHLSHVATNALFLVWFEKKELEKLNGNTKAD